MAKWIHETSMFKLISNLFTFKHHMLRKLFRCWKSSVSYLKFLRTRDSIKTHLFYMKPHFRDALPLLGHLADFVSKFAMVLEARKAGSIHEFRARQKSYMDNNVLTDVSELGKLFVEIVDKTSKDLRAHILKLNVEEDALDTGGYIEAMCKSMRDARLERERVRQTIRRTRQ